MKIKMELDQKAMSKSRKFVMFVNSNCTPGDGLTRYTIGQASTVYNALSELQNVEIENNTGLTF